MGLIRRYYRQNGFDRAWTCERFYRLCQRLRLLPEELGALCQIEPKRLGAWLKAGRFPPYVGLHFSIIERITL